MLLQKIIFIYQFIQIINLPLKRDYVVRRKFNPSRGMDRLYSKERITKVGPINDFKPTIYPIK
jgi:hypothetical protein